MERALFVGYWEGCSHDGEAAWSFYKFHPPRGEPKGCLQWERGAELESQEMWGSEGRQQQAEQGHLPVTTQGQIRCCLASRQELKLSNHVGLKGKILLSSSGWSGGKNCPAGLGVGGELRAEELQGTITP